MLKDLNEIGALWEKTSANGNAYMTGEVNGVKVVLFKAKKQSDKSPDWRVLLSQPKDGPSEGTRRLDTREAKPRDSRVDDPYDVGF